MVGDQITAAKLAEATVRLNNKIRNRGYTSLEIHFSRDFVNSENLNINDEELQEQQVEKCLYNHPYASQLKTPGAPIQSKADAETGDLVYIKNDLDKHTGRAPHLVLEKKDNKCLIKKRIHTSANDQKILTFFSYTKLVDSKFLFKQKNKSPLFTCHNVPTPSLDDINEDTELKETMRDEEDSSTQHKDKLWFPYDLENEKLIIIEQEPIDDAVDQLEDDNNTRSEHNDTERNSILDLEDTKLIIKEPIDDAEDQIGDEYEYEYEYLFPIQMVADIKNPENLVQGVPLSNSRIGAM